MDHAEQQQQPTTLSLPRCDGRRVLFEIEDGDRRIACAISLAALQDVSRRRHFKASELLMCFAEARGRIEAIARDKARGRSEGVSGLLSIWADDIDDPPPAGEPVAARRPRALRTG